MRIPDGSTKVAVRATKTATRTGMTNSPVCQLMMPGAPCADPFASKVKFAAAGLDYKE